MKCGCNLEELKSMRDGILKFDLGIEVLSEWEGSVILGGEFTIFVKWLYYLIWEV